MTESEIEKYKPNSHAYKEQQQAASEKKVSQIASGKIKKKTGVQKLKDFIFLEDTKNVKEYVLKDIIIPGIKDLAFKMFTNGLSMYLFKDQSHAKHNSTGSSAYRYSYNTCYPGSSGLKTNRNTRDDYEYDDIVFETRGIAEEVLISLEDMIDRYNMASVSDFYDLCGITGKYTDCKYGWTNLKDAEPIRVSDGYMIRFPKVEPLN